MRARPGQARPPCSGSADIGFDSSVPPYDPQLFAVPAGDTQVECDYMNNACSFR